MKFIDLLNKYSSEQFKTYLDNREKTYVHNLKEDKVSISYNECINKYDLINVFEELKKLKPYKKESKYYIEIEEMYEDKYDENSPYTVVVNCKDGITKNDYNDDGLERFALDFKKWREVLTMDISEYTIKYRLSLEIIQLVIESITVFGYSEREIQYTANKLRNRLKDIEKNSEKFVDFEEVKKRVLKNIGEKKVNIFVLEDSADRVKWFFENFSDHNLTISNNALHAIKNLYLDKFDIIFLDHDLGGQAFVNSSGFNTGYTVAKQIPETKNNDTRVIIHSWNSAGAKNMLEELKNNSNFKSSVVYLMFGTFDKNVLFN